MPAIKERQAVLALIESRLATASLEAKRRTRLASAVMVPQTPLEWACAKATIVHPMRGRIPFSPYPYQSAFLDDRSPRRLVLKARQIGFSQAFALDATHKAIHTPDTTILLVSRNQELAANLLGYCYNALAGLHGQVPEFTKQNESEIGFANGSRIKSLPANRSTGRGFAASDVYLDEFAFCQYAEEIYRSVGPTVAHGGRLTVGSTPDGRGNLFFQLWAGLEGGDWSRHEVAWWECSAYNPSRTKPADPWQVPWYAQERPNYTAQSFASEYDCDFIASGQAVFRTEDVDACSDGWQGLQAARPGHRYVTAWDIGRRQDATVGITLDVTDDAHQMVAYERHLGMPYPSIQRCIETRARAYPGVHVVESNGVGDPVIENLEVNVDPFTTTAKSKERAVTALALAHENRTIKHDIEQLRRECHLYQHQDQGLIQDCVMAAAIAELHAGGVVVAGSGRDPEPAFRHRFGGRR